jgi:hypothetical protein
MVALFGSNPVRGSIDDLEEGRGAEYVDASSVCLIFCSGGYFNSPNCAWAGSCAFACQTLTGRGCSSRVLIQACARCFVRH